MTQAFSLKHLIFSAIFVPSATLAGLAGASVPRPAAGNPVPDYGPRMLLPLPVPSSSQTMAGRRKFGKKASSMTVNNRSGLASGFRSLGVIVGLAVGLVALGLAEASAQDVVALSDGESQARAQGKVPGQYIVVLNNDVVNPRGMAASMGRLHGFSVQHTYSSALKGFSARMPAHMAAALAADPNVAYVEQDTYMYAATNLWVPAGVLRLDADLNPLWADPAVSGLVANIRNLDVDITPGTVDVDIAILDTGIDNDNLDLTVYRTRDCSGRSPTKGSCRNGSADDSNGHGTVVAGVAAASGQVHFIGVAPGARLWAVKVLGDNGSGFASWTIAGVDWVTENAAEIDVANMSLAGANSPALNAAIAASVAAGVTYVVAAGNDGVDAVNTSPANSPDAITVSAIADFDGMGGGVGLSLSVADGWPAFCEEEDDDTFTTFSNHGTVVDIAAPGACVISTFPGDMLGVASGTSFASPHVAGAAALIIAEASGPRPTPGEVRAELLARAIAQDDPSGGYDAANDDDGVREPLVNVASGPVNAAPTVSIAAPADLATFFVSGGIEFVGSASDPDGNPDGTASDVTGSLVWKSDGVEFGIGGSTVTAHTDVLGEGVHTITATATDADGAVGSASITITVDTVNDAPVVTITNPAGGATVSGTVTIAVDATDDGDAAGSLIVVIQAGSQTAQPAQYNEVSGLYEASWNTALEEDGSHTISAQAMDSGSQVGRDGPVAVTVNNTVTSEVLYVGSIAFRLQGPHLLVTVTIRQDDDGVADGGDAAAVGAVISQVLLTQAEGGSWAFSPLTTDSAGQANYKLIKAQSGSYTFEVVTVSRDADVWDPLFGGANPSGSFVKP